MDGYLNPIDGTGYTDGQHVDIAMFEYAQEITVGKKLKLVMLATSAPSPKFTTMYMAMKSRFMY